MAGGHAKMWYTMSGLSGREMVDARMDEARDTDGGIWESTDEPVLSCGSCTLAAMSVGGHENRERRSKRCCDRSWEDLAGDCAKL